MRENVCVCVNEGGLAHRLLETVLVQFEPKCPSPRL